MRPSSNSAGRVRLKGTARVEKKYALKSYSIDFKTVLLTYWDQAAVEQTLKKF